MRSFTPALAFLLAVSQVALAQDPSNFDTGLDNHMGLVFSPDGDTAFWVAWNGRWGSDSAGKRTIYMSQQMDGSWSSPLAMPFSTNYSDDDPFVSPDGRWLYFVSDRPASDGDTSSDGDIWRYCLAESRGLERLSVNSDMAEYSPIVTTSGTLYFASTRDGGYGQGDLYTATLNGLDFNTPTNLGASINSVTWLSMAQRSSTASRCNVGAMTPSAI